MLQEFISNINAKKGLSKTSRFKVNLLVPSGASISPRSLELQCETVDLPGKSLTTQDVKIYGPAYKMAINKQFSNEITMSFLCTNRGYERKTFDDWIEYINPIDTNNLRFPEVYLSDIFITQYDESFSGKESKADSNVINRVILSDCFPIGYAAQPLNWGDDGFQRLSVQFSYRIFRQIK